mmetsp:Transcript_58805/g.137327  ORF Transcript_58805/g.137327 Transcript_58805/m.137327 type:complete len:271 (-) Transcript_58805:61-873(-)
MIVRYFLLALLAQLWLQASASGPRSAYSGPSEDDDDEEYDECDVRVDPFEDKVAPGSGKTFFVLEHGFLAGEETSWSPRGTVMLSGDHCKGFRAEVSEAKEFVQVKKELPASMLQAAQAQRYYAIRMYSPETPKRILQASIPATLLANNFEDWHDILKVTVGSAGVPVSLSYRVRNTLGLALFDHTQVQIAEPSKADGPRVPPAAKDAAAGPGGAAAQPEATTPQSFLRRYWWVVIIAVLLLYGGADDGGGAKSGGGGGGGGGGGARRAG